MQSIRKDSHGGTLCLWQNCGKCQGIILQSSSCHDQQYLHHSERFLQVDFVCKAIVWYTGFTISQHHLEVSYPIYLFKVKKPEIFSHLKHHDLKCRNLFSWCRISGMNHGSPKLSTQSITGMTADLKLFPSKFAQTRRKWKCSWDVGWRSTMTIGPDSNCTRFQKVVSVKLGWQDLERMEENKRRYMNMTGESEEVWWFSHVLLGWFPSMCNLVHLKRRPWMNLFVLRESPQTSVGTFYFFC